MKKIIIITALFSSLLSIVSCNGTRPTDFGTTNGRLKACPDKPNCVISFPSDEEHFIQPIGYSGDKEAAMDIINTILKSEGRVSIIEAKGSPLDGKHGFDHGYKKPYSTRTGDL